MKLSESQRRGAVSEPAQMLRELHSWRPPVPVAEAVCERPDLRLGTITGLIGSDVTPLPLERALALAAHAATLPDVDSGLIADAARAMQDLRAFDPALEDPSRHGLVHGDLHLNNLWWSESAGLVLLDLEWVRFGPPSLDLLRCATLATRMCCAATTCIRACCAGWRRTIRNCSAGPTFGPGSGCTRWHLPSGRSSWPPHAATKTH